MAEGFKLTILERRLQSGEVYTGTRQPAGSISIPSLLAVECLQCGAKFRASESAASVPGTFQWLAFGSALITCPKCEQSATHQVG